MRAPGVMWGFTRFVLSFWWHLTFLIWCQIQCLMDMSFLGLHAFIIAAAHFKVQRCYSIWNSRQKSFVGVFKCEQHQLKKILFFSTHIRLHFIMMLMRTIHLKTACDRFSWWHYLFWQLSCWHPPPKFTRDIMRYLYPCPPPPRWTPQHHQIF